MPRDPRYLPPGWSVEVTTRTICGFYLLPATTHFACVMVGILARAQEKYPVKVHAAVAASNHYHLILTPEDVDQLADFMEFVTGNLAREAGRLSTPVERLDRGAFMMPYKLKLAPLPCWQNLPAAEIRKRVAQMVAEIEGAAAQLREELGTELLGMDRICH